MIQHEKHIDQEEHSVLEAKAIKTGPRIYEEIRRMAMEYRFKPNERINEVELAARLNVSRSPIREALQRLVTEGLITFQPNRGFFCRGFDVDEVVNLSDVRCLLEERAVVLAIKRASDEELRALVDWWRATAARADALSSADLTSKDEEFHMRIAKMSGNPELARMIEGINTRIHFVRQIEVEKHRRLSTTYTEHTDIARAMAARDADRAARIMRDHISISVADAVSSVKEGLARIFMRVD
ncbi:GntR family transcriptional regulator [Agrobacterium rhizogenes]|uniref:GntR family transcriptional regulator n=1 Tax=Rhizobium rhizogenes NBRC 13257 TaxID=1220581 RepID=A0AA87Q2T9_RHIRH|nr:GntR family transcriptional regulator [Rhizobium rhizogenes]KAA6486122.1 GntR family transcriptional regulator [Agrobacterium sp. ICMP 7243]KEA03650.1 transcriptional regulator [Rhizobium rhizogenes]MDJ1634052.1 GntR family transcriptional regulator [Rhizobium rhizogenes]MQB33028.1 GntR family transcriptional regulator [Rhizobium rhizogenes]NTF50580.1 GntR family transcriptional regulator [Rhizobium rhizogenes]